MKSWRTCFMEWRHIAYRAKVKYFYNTKAHGWFRNKLWPLATKESGQTVRYCNAEPEFDEFEFDDITDDVARGYVVNNTRKWSACHPDVIYDCTGNILIEPRRSLAVIDRKYFIEPTRGGAHAIMTPPISMKLHGATRSDCHLPTVIHFDGFLRTNLFHFMMDAMNPFLMMRASELIDFTQPMLINRQVYDRAYVRELLKLPCFEGVNWKVQEPGEYVATTRLIKGQASFAQFSRTYDELATMVDKQPHRRVFLDRRPAVQRRLINMDEIGQVLADHGFETVFAEDLSYLDQAALFAQTSHIVGLHGAGLTNLLFCDLPNTRLLELNSKTFLNPHFFWMTNVLGVQYHDIIAGSDLDINWNYSIDPQAFDAHVKVLVSI
jgi:hypothetical protein